MARTWFRLLTLSLLTLTFHSVVNATDNPQLREILNKHWEAMGGMRNWSEVESIQLNGTIEREGQVVDIVIVKKRPDQIRATVTIPIPGDDEEKLQIIRAHDGKTAWTATRMAGAPEMKKEELGPEAAAELLADAGVLPKLIKLWRAGAELELMDPTQIGKEHAITISATHVESSRTQIFYLSPDNFRLVAQETISETTGTTRTTVDGYLSESGIYLPQTTTIESELTGRSVMKAESIKVGVGIYEEYFGIEQFETASTK